MTNQYPRLRSHTRRRKSGKVTTYYFYDRRATGEPDVPLGKDYDQAIEKWKEIYHDAPRLIGTLEEAFRKWEKDEDSGLLSKKRETQKDYARCLNKLRPVFGPSSWEAVQLVHLKAYLNKRSAKVRGNREMSTLSLIWNWARLEGLTTLPWPAAGMEKSKWKNKENAREFEVTDDLFEAAYQAGDQILRDCMDLASATGMRLKDTVSVLLPANDVLRLKANKTGKKADFDLSLSEVLPELVKRRRALRADHLMLLSTPTGRPVTYSMLRTRWDFAREWAALNADAAGEHDLAADLRAMFLRDMRKRASDLMDTDEDASLLLQHSSVNVTKKHYRTKVTKLRPAR